MRLFADIAYYLLFLSRSSQLHFHPEIPARPILWPVMTDSRGHAIVIAVPDEGLLSPTHAAKIARLRYSVGILEYVVDLNGRNGCDDVRAVFCCGISDRR